jgi:hypothetical protein
MLPRPDGADDLALPAAAEALPSLGITETSRIPAPAPDSLELLAVELAGFDRLITKIVEPSGRARFLRVVSRELGQLAEDVTWRPADQTDGSAPQYLYSWGEPIPGTDPAEVARSITRVLGVEPMPTRSAR